MGRTGTFSPASRLTDAQGRVTFTYTPVAVPIGTDYLTLFLDNNNNNLWEPQLGEGSSQALVTWGTPTLSIAAVDASASEANSDTATFRITRAGGPSSPAYASGINDAGVIVGSYYNTALGRYSPVRWSGPNPGQVVELPVLNPVPGSLGNQANAITRAYIKKIYEHEEMIVGWNVNHLGKYRAVVWDHQGILTALHVT